MKRLQTFEKAKSACTNLLKKYPGDQALQSIITQLQFLIELESGIRMDAERLKDIIIGVLATREIDQLDENVALLLGDVCDEVNSLKHQWSCRGIDVGEV